MANHPKNNLNLLFFFGRPFSPLYGAVMKTRELLYHRRFFRSYRMPVPVISVGNLTLGGTGKTPTVEHVSKLLVANGFQPAIVSRGYGGSASKRVNVVSDGNKLYLNAEKAGDEPYMLASNLEGVPVVTGKKRYYPCLHAIDEFDVDCIILDDGFQHLSLYRDIDLVLFDSTHLAGQSRIFPGGELREPVSALKRCNYFLLTGGNETNRNQADRFGQLLQSKFPNKLVYHAEATPRLHLENKKRIEQSGNIPKEGGENLYAFCGIANPQRFMDSIASVDCQLVGSETFSDHAKYTQPIIESVENRAIELGATALVTTQKDLVKLETLHCKLPVYSIQVTHSYPNDFDEQLINDVNNSLSSNR